MASAVTSWFRQGPTQYNETRLKNEILWNDQELKQFVIEITKQFDQIKNHLSLESLWMIRDRIQQHRIFVDDIDRHIEYVFPDYWNAMMMTKQISDEHRSSMFSALENFHGGAQGNYLHSNAHRKTESIQEMKDVFQRAYHTQNVMFVYRGLKETKKENIRMNVDGNQSTTFSRSIAEAYSGDRTQAIVLLIRIPVGTPILALSLIKHQFVYYYSSIDECEIILPTNASFRIISDDDVDDTKEFEQEAKSMNFRLSNPLVPKQTVYVDLLTGEKIKPKKRERSVQPVFQDEKSMKREIKAMAKAGTNVPFGKIANRQLRSEDIDRGLQYLANTIKYHPLPAISGDTRSFPQKSKRKFTNTHKDEPLIMIMPCVSIATVLNIWQDDPFYIKLLSGQTNTRILLMGVVKSELNRHWMLLAIDIEHFYLTVFNSLKMDDIDEILKPIETFFDDYLPELNYQTLYSDLSLLRDASNCGVFVFEFARLYLQHQLFYQAKPTDVDFTINVGALKRIDILEKRREWSDILYNE